MERTDKNIKIAQALESLGIDPIDVIDYDKIHKIGMEIIDRIKDDPEAVYTVSGVLNTITGTNYNPFTPTVVEEQLDDVDIRFLNAPEPIYDEANDVYKTILIKPGEKEVTFTYKRKVKNKETGFDWGIYTKEHTLAIDPFKRYYLLPKMGDVDTTKEVEKDLLITINYIY